MSRRRNSWAVPACEGQSFWARGRAHSSLDFNFSPFFHPSLVSLPKFPSSQPQAFHRGNISAETEGSKEQVATGTSTDRCFGERGCFAGSPTSEHIRRGRQHHPPCPALPSPAAPQPFLRFSRDLSFKPPQEPGREGFTPQQLCPPLGARPATPRLF